MYVHRHFQQNKRRQGLQVNYRALHATVGLLCVIIGCKVVNAGEITLCQPHEEIYFSCPIDGKVVSLCASGNISPDNGYVQYRYGVPGRVELQFPEKRNPPRNLFGIIDIYVGNLNFTHVKFMVGAYGYVIYQGSPSGVYVKRHGGVISNYMCAPGIYQRLNQRVFRGLRTNSPVDGVDG